MDISKVFAAQIMPPGLQEFAKPFTLVRQKPLRLLIGFRVENIFFGMCDV